MAKMRIYVAAISVLVKRPHGTHVAVIIPLCRWSYRLFVSSHFAQPKTTSDLQLSGSVPPSLWSGQNTL